MGQCCTTVSTYLTCENQEDEKPLISKEERQFSFEAQQLSQAVVSGDYEAVQLLLTECTTISINERDGTGCTALYRAVVYNHYDIAKLLLSLGASPNEVTSDGYAPLHGAAKNGNTQMISILVEHQANINATNLLSQTPLHLAVQHNHLPAVKKLVDFGADINAHVSCPASAPMPSSSVSSSLSTSINSSHKRSHSPSRAGHSRHSSMSSVPSIISSNPIPSPLLLACTFGYTPIIQFLIQSGANPIDDDSDLNNNSALMVCCDNGHVSSAEYLLKYFNLLQEELQESNILQSQLCKQSKFHSWTALHFAASGGHADICELLILYGTPLDLQDDIGRTPLHHASAKGHPECVKVLVEYGANVDIRDDYSNYSADTEGSEKRGKTPLDLANETIHYHRVSRAFREALSARSAKSPTASSSPQSYGSPQLTPAGSYTQPASKRTSPLRPAAVPREQPHSGKNSLLRAALKV